MAADRGRVARGDAGAVPPGVDARPPGGANFIDGDAADPRGAAQRGAPRDPAADLALGAAHLRGPARGTPPAPRTPPLLPGTAYADAVRLPAHPRGDLQLRRVRRGGA